MTKGQSALLRDERLKYEKYLKFNDLKLTSGRRKVFALAMDMHGHFTAEGTVKRSQRRKIDVSRATIYRCLNEMLEAGVIRETAFGEKHQFFEHFYDEQPHHHARCVRCSTILEFPDLKEDSVYTSLLEKKGFSILGHEMHFYGICKKCR